MPDAKTVNRPDKTESRVPAKGGTKPAHENSYPSGDSPKPHGDPMQHAVEQEKKK